MNVPLRVADWRSGQAGGPRCRTPGVAAPQQQRAPWRSGQKKSPPKRGL